MLTKSSIAENLAQMLPSENVLKTEEERYVYAEDATNTRASQKLPDAVVFVENIEQVQQVVRYAYKNSIPIVCRGAGTNLVGACLPDFGGIVLNFTKMNNILEINQENMTAKVQPGVIVGELQKQVEALGLFYPPDPSNLKVSTIGGSIAQSAGGPKTFKYGSTKDYVLEMKVVLADGSLVSIGAGTIKDSTGYHLAQLFVGSEGTLGILVEATLKLIPKPEASRVIMAYFDSIESSATAVNDIIKNQLMPSTIDFMDRNSINTVEKFYPAGLDCTKEATLIIEIDGYECSLDYQQEKITNILELSGASGIQFSKTQEESDKIWTARRSSFAAAAKLRPDVMTEDIIVPRNNIPELISGINNICDKKGLERCIVGHLGDGNVHPQIVLDLENDNEFKTYMQAKQEIYTLAISLGGTLSGEHGIGTEKRQFIPQAVDDIALDYMRKIKKLFDEKNILNPGKIF